MAAPSNVASALWGQAFRPAAGLSPGAPLAKKESEPSKDLPSRREPRTAYPVSRQPSLTRNAGRKPGAKPDGLLHKILCLSLLALSPLWAQTSERQRHLLTDWAGLTRYGSDDTEIPPPKSGENRIVFLGDQITEEWGKDGNGQFFPGKPFINRGIRDQASAQMLVRFRQDVIELQPKVVIIEAGTNDLASLAGPSTEGTMMENFMSMVELAKVHNIRVVLASVLPVCDCFNNQTALRPQGKIIGLNGAIKDYAAKSGSVYLNYYSALASGRDFKKELTSDGLLPNAAGYAVMAPLAEHAIADALAAK